jgi:hypothetical protein
MHGVVPSICSSCTIRYHSVRRFAQPLYAKGVGENGASWKADSLDQLDAGVIEFINNL